MLALFRSICLFVCVPASSAFFFFLFFSALLSNGSMKQKTKEKRRRMVHNTIAVRHEAAGVGCAFSFLFITIIVLLWRARLALPGHYLLLLYISALHYYPLHICFWAATIMLVVALRSTSPTALSKRVSEYISSF